MNEDPFKCALFIQDEVPKYHADYVHLLAGSAAKNLHGSNEPMTMNNIKALKVDISQACMS